MNERAVVFESSGNRLVGIAHCAEPRRGGVGVLIVVGGPQTRVGSHRQFVSLSRYLAQHGIPSLRFDYAGMGDSDGTGGHFLAAGEDIDKAVAACIAELGVDRVVIWGLCDAASAALLYCRNFPTQRIAGLVLLNPWVRTEQGEAKTIVRHYYLQRLTEPGFWRKVARLEFDVLGSARALLANLRKAARGRSGVGSELGVATTAENYVAHMLEGLQQFDGAVLLVISGRDLTATEFTDLARADADWRAAVAGRVTRRLNLPQADHTFSDAECRVEVERATLELLQSLA